MGTFLTCLTVALLVSGQAQASVNDVAAESERGRKKWTEYYSDDANLRSYLQGEFGAVEGSHWEDAEQFKTEFSVSDERLRGAVMSVYADANAAREAARLRGEERPTDQVANNALLWLGACADAKIEGFLLGVAADGSKDSVLRRCAISSFLRAADSEQAKQALIRFLTGEDRMDAMMRLSVYEYARMAYDKASADKRQAIAAALFAAAAHEGGKIEFMEVDRILSARSDAYRRSRQRLAMLERHSREPPTANLYTDRDLKAALAEARRLRNHTNISTNLDLLRNWDLGQPLPSPDGSFIDIATAPPEAFAAPPLSEGDTKRTKERILYIGGAAALAVAAGSVWLARRRRRASRP